MKIWTSFSGEHSSNLRIVATFKDADYAKKAENLFNRLLEISTTTSLTLSDMWGENELAKLLKAEQCYDVCNDEDFARLEYFAPLNAQGNKISLKMDTYDIQPVVKTLLFYHAKIEMYDLDANPDMA